MKKTKTGRLASILLLIILVANTAGCSSNIQPTESKAPNPAADGAISSSPATPSAENSPAAPGVMPDLVNMNFDEASAMLVSFNVQITKESKISPDAPGTVVSQSPVAGAPFQTSVTLTVSTAPPTVPDVKNLTIAIAEQKLTDLGFQIEEVPKFDEEIVDGLVVSQDPPAGTSNAGKILLVVARHPVVTYLDSMNYVKTDIYDWQLGQGKTNGVLYSHGILVSPGGTSNRITEFDLSREYRRFVGTLGMSDDAPTDASAIVEIIGDGRVLKSYNLIFGKPIVVDLDVSQVLRLAITMTVSDYETKIVLGDFQLQGLLSEVKSDDTVETSEMPGG